MQLLDGLQEKIDLLRAESKATTDLLESKNAELQNEIIQLKAEVKSNPSSRSFSNKGRADRHSIKIDDDTSFINKKRSSDGESSMRAVSYPSSCDDLSTIGHSLDAFYLVKNPTTSKMETVFCDFVTSGKLKTKNIPIY